MGGFKDLARISLAMKYVIIIPDGCADYPVESLGGKTPLQAARTPNMDAVAQAGLVGRSDNVPLHLPAGSEVANMTLCHPYTDAEYVVYDEHWGDSGEVVRRIEGRDWNALYRAADAAIQASGDSHHSFIESFTPIEDKPGHLRLHTGS